MSNFLATSNSKKSLMALGIAIGLSCSSAAFAYDCDMRIHGSNCENVAVPTSSMPTLTGSVHLLDFKDSVVKLTGDEYCTAVTVVPGATNGSKVGFGGEGSGIDLTKNYYPVTIGDDNAYIKLGNKGDPASAPCHITITGPDS